MQALVKRLYGLVDRLTHYLWFMAPLLTRASVGITFYYTGYGKTHNLEAHANLIKLMTESGVPFPQLNAWMVGYLEWIGAVLLLAGLLTRPAAVALLGSMMVALLTADRGDFLGSWGPTGDKGPLDISSFALLCYLLWLVMFGAGPLSLDWLFGSFLRRWAGVPAAGTTFGHHNWIENGQGSGNN